MNIIKLTGFNIPIYPKFGEMGPLYIQEPKQNLEC